MEQVQTVDLAQRLYALYREECAGLPEEGRIMPYHWYRMPRTLPIHWFAYGEMLREFAGELANSINSLRSNTHRLRAWGALLPKLTSDEILEAKLEFVDVLGIAGLGMPYAIKSRFTYAAAHLCHQANRA